MNDPIELANEAEAMVKAINQGEHPFDTYPLDDVIELVSAIRELVQQNESRQNIINRVIELSTENQRLYGEVTQLREEISREKIEDLENRLSQVFDHFTNGRISKPYTDPRDVFQTAQGVEQDAQEEELKEWREEVARLREELEKKEEVVEAASAYVRAEQRTAALPLMVALDKLALSPTTEEEE